MNQNNRQVVLDIEVTGLSPRSGDRIVEIGAIELVDGAMTGRLFHRRLNPEREIDPQVSTIIGFSWYTLKREPKFSEVAGEFQEFISGAELIMHNAPFDLDFLNAELRRCEMPELTNSVIDTLVIARALYPGQKNNLDALCERYQINQTYPEWSGFLQDARAIADVYLAMSVD